MFFQHSCTILRPTKSVVAGTETVTFSEVATSVPCTLWSPKKRRDDNSLGRDVAMDQREFMTATEILSGDVVDVEGFGKYLVGAVDNNKSLKKGWSDNFYTIVSKYANL